MQTSDIKIIKYGYFRKKRLTQGGPAKRNKKNHVHCHYCVQEVNLEYSRASKINKNISAASFS